MADEVTRELLKGDSLSGNSRPGLICTTCRRPYPSLCRCTAYTRAAAAAQKWEQSADVDVQQPNDPDPDPDAESVLTDLYGP